MSTRLMVLVAIVIAGCGGSSGSGNTDAGTGDGGGGTPDAEVGCGLNTCEQAGASCGQVGDGCSGTLECGDCTAPATCGGGGEPSTCGGTLGCVPADCTSVGATCGPIGDGCGGSVASCGSCTGDDTCGGGGTPSVCGAPVVACTNLCNQQVDCTPGTTTSVSGTVFTPAGDLPLYNVSVYVPNAALDPITTGNTTCESCDAPLSGEPLVHTVTDAAGNFVLNDVPVGANIPLVIQTGKWRRVITIPTVTQCVDNPLTADLTRFPRTQGEGGVAENNIPRIALTTGSADALECLMLKIGIDISEFTPQAGTGRVNLYAGAGGTDRYEATVNGGASFSSSQTLWNQLSSLDDYDMVMLSCEGAHAANAGAGALQAMSDYLATRGGRVFGSHWHHSWVESGPAPMPTVGSFADNLSDLPSPHTVTVNQAFAKGAALAEWLVNVGASTTLGQLPLLAGQHTVTAATAATSLAWITGTNPNEANAAGVQYMSFNTPIGSPADQQCGRMVLTDIHVSATDDSATNLRFPHGSDNGNTDGCDTVGLLPEEKALIFLLFDLASCVTTDLPGCDPRTCESVGATCGPVADGCGALLQCGECVAPDTCGGGGTPNQCGNDGCVPTDCATAGAECGPVADGCGATLDCGECVLPETCGGGGTPNQCGAGGGVE